MVVYADMVWLLNAGIDLALLLLTAAILKQRVKRWRLLAGALIGSSIVIFAFTPWAQVMTHPLMKLLYSFFIVYTTFGFTRFRTFIQILLMFYFVTFMVGGGLIGFHFFLQTSPLLGGMVSTSTISFGDPVSWVFVLLGVPAAYYFSKKRIEHVEITHIRFDQMVQVELVVGQKVKQIKALIDSGNQLYDPITKTPVMIVEAACTGDLFPTWLLEQAKEPHRFQDAPEEDDWLTRLRMIPYRGVGQSNSFLLAVKPDCIRIHKDGEVLSVQRVLIGITHTTLSADREYECILHPKLLLTAGSITA
ncbi:sigma-E processing peptidase SpoIIGA [Ectobacillus ponti]|uniref:Sporulation sigma-E factor-processing peptidase n=1 Tax=Ectobacillus ponti TaxID=2961894 RepID=A0AA41X7M2_9BACI|nr:sigma-E processing peptidase SpoIIGA [Ectobacillus ponti]MCP8970237.1 sigma-E processing peptidase SpoIIGA [Ectobacillus ponti]